MNRIHGGPKHDSGSPNGSHRGLVTERQLRAMMDALRAHVATQQHLHRRFYVLVSALGVGKVALLALLALLADLPELGARNGKQIAALVGVAPHHRQSGAGLGRSAIAGGRADLRRILYIAALSAARCNPARKT